MPHRRPFNQAKRRQVLASLAPMLIALGISYTFNVSEVRIASFGWLPWFLGIQTVGVGWLIAGVVCAGVAVLRPRLPRRAESVAFAAAIVPLVYTAAIFIASWAGGLNPDGYLTAFIYGGLAALIVNTSSWQEQDIEVPHATLR